MLEAGAHEFNIFFAGQALMITREISDRRGEGIGLWNTALAHNQLGNLAGTIAHAKEALAIFEAIEDPNAAKGARLLQSGAARRGSFEFFVMMD
jgi:hypothetical protein